MEVGIARESNPEERGRKQIKPLRVLGRGRHALKRGALNINKINDGGPNGIRNRVSALRGPCPGPLDDGATSRETAARKWKGEEDSNHRYVDQSHASYHN